MDEGNRIWILLSKQLSRTITLDERIELGELLVHDPEAWYTMEVLEGIKKGEEVPEELVDEIKSLLQKRNHDGLNGIASKPKKAGARGWLRLAGVAAVVLLVVAGVSAYFATKQRPVELANTTLEIISPNGSQISHTMPDGTKIRLNAGSKITYAKNDAPATLREIHLTGEAFFEVVYNEDRPFVVHTPDFTIRNLGTSFNVKSYPDDEIVEATLIEGSIEVVLKSNADHKFVMQPNEKLVFYRNGEVVRDEIGQPETTSPGTGAGYELAPVTLDEYSSEIIETAWLQDKLIFKQEPFGALAKRIERRFNVDIHIDNEEISTQRLTGKFEDEDLEASLKVLQMIVPFRYTIQGNTVNISQ